MITTSSTTLSLTLENVLRHALDGVFVIDGNRRVVFFSEGCERITGVERTAAIGTPCPCHDLLECQDEYGRSLSGTLCPSTKVFNEEVASYRQRIAIQHADGHRALVETTYSPLKDDSGKITAYKIERRQRPSGPWTDAGMTIESEIALSAQERGKEWEYRVITVNKARPGTPTNTVMVVL